MLELESKAAVEGVLVQEQEQDTGKDMDNMVDSTVAVYMLHLCILRLSLLHSNLSSDDDVNDDLLRLRRRAQQVPQ